MWQARQIESLKAEIESVIEPLSEIEGFYNLVKESLTKLRRGLASNSKQTQLWILLPLIVSESICECYEHVLPAAAALQLLMAAGDVFDDIEDADSNESLSTQYNIAIATNIATTLLILAEKSITRLKERGVENSIIVQLTELINSYYLTACSGQHLDISLLSNATISEEKYTKIISMKSASQITCSCHIGALLSTTNQELINKFISFGSSLGMIAQIANDIHGILDEKDIMKHKITLPVVYALSQTEGEVHHRLDLQFNKKSEPALDASLIKDLLFKTGAMHYAAIKLEFYRQQAMDILHDIEKLGVNTDQLKVFLE